MRANQALNEAISSAEHFGHTYIGSEHLLLGLVKAEGSVASVLLTKRGVTPEKIIELIENSIDAGAKNITVEIQNGGIKLMQVSDDGCGIDEEDVKSAFLPHATSKIKEARINLLLFYSLITNLYVPLKDLYKLYD